MKKNIFIPFTTALGMLLITPALHSQDIVTVTDCNLNGWVKDQRGNSKVSFTSGPSTPPLGKGSLNISAPDAHSTVGRIRNGQYSGLLLSAITELSFSTFIEQRNSTVNPYSDALFLVLQVDANNDNVAEFHLVFDPSSQTQPFVQNNFPDQGVTEVGIWQTWDMFHGGWFDGADDPQHGFPLFSLTSFIAQHPNARILNDATQGGAAIRLSGGGPVSSGNFIGDIDNFRIGVNGVTTIYDFEFDIADAGGDKNVVYGYGSNCITLNGTAAGGVAPYSYSWSPGGSSSDNVEVCPPSTTTYTLTVTDKNGCTGTDDATVFVNDVRCGNKLDKVQLCHNGVAICVSKDAVPAHLNHGDQLGICMQSASAATGIAGETKLTAPNELMLSTYPNPFVTSTSLQYVLPCDGKVVTRLYDITGKLMRTILTADKKAGEHKFDFTRGTLPPGLYYARMILRTKLLYYTSTQKLIIRSE